MLNNEIFDYGKANARDVENENRYQNKQTLVDFQFQEEIQSHFNCSVLEQRLRNGKESLWLNSERGNRNITRHLSNCRCR